jgi:hypothetical protein
VDLGAFNTDPADPDTDDDGLPDGYVTGEVSEGEDVNWDGHRQGWNPYDCDDDALGEETDPVVADTDRDGQLDELDTHPLNLCFGGEDLDIHREAGTVQHDTLKLGSYAAGLIPGDVEMGTFRVYNTSGGDNPDAWDGPCVFATLDTVYMRATSFRWVKAVDDTAYVDPPSDVWLHYDCVSFDPEFVIDMDGVSDYTVEVTVTVPDGAMPGIYRGWIQVFEADPSRFKPDDDNEKMELPTDWVEFLLVIGPGKDIDVCDNDGMKCGVGMAQQPLDFGRDADYGEMHIRAVAGYPNPVPGEWRFANPNTNPDGPYGMLDMENDFNRLPARPYVMRDWDLPLPSDPQGNIDLGLLRAWYDHQYSPVDGFVNPTDEVLLDDPIADELLFPYWIDEEAGTWGGGLDSTMLYIETADIPHTYNGTGMINPYWGWIRIFEDVDLDGVQGVGEEADTFMVCYDFVVPDLDIDNEYGQWIDDNIVEFDVMPGQTEFEHGYVRIFNDDGTIGPGATDPEDGPSTEALNGFFQFYDPRDQTLTEIHSAQSVETTLWRRGALPEREEWVKIEFFAINPETPFLRGDVRDLGIRVTEVPEGARAGQYIMGNPADWFDDPNDLPSPASGLASVPICGRGYDTGNGWLDGECGQGAVFMEDVDAVNTLLDEMLVFVNVAEVVNVVWGEDEEPDTYEGRAMPCETHHGCYPISNIGNCDAYDIRAEFSNLVGENFGHILPSGGITLDPDLMEELPYGESDTLCFSIPIPCDLRHDWYKGTATLYAYDSAGGNCTDVLEVYLKVGADPEIAIMPDPLTDSIDPDESTASTAAFVVDNTGTVPIVSMDAMFEWKHGDDDRFIVTPTVCDELGFDDDCNGSLAVEYAVGWTEIYAQDYEGTLWVYGTADTVGGHRLTGQDTVDYVLTVEPKLEAVLGDSLYDLGMVDAGAEEAMFEIEIANVGNCEIGCGHLELEFSDLEGASGSVIPAEAMDVDACDANVPWQGSESFDVTVDIPAGLLGQVYYGEVELYLDGTFKSRAHVMLEIGRDDDYARIYPNPYRASEGDGPMMFAFGDVDLSGMSIMIYDMYGRLVKDLSSEAQSSRGDVEWHLDNDDGKDIASGMYIVTIDMGEEVVTKKIMVIR